MLRECVLNSHDRNRSNYLIIFTLIFFTLIILNFVLIDKAHAGEVTLTWDANTDTNLAGYKLYYGSSSGNYQYSVDVANVTTYTLMNLPDGEIYYFAATAYDVYGNESSFSEEIAYAVNNQPPVADAGPDQSIASGLTLTLSGANSYDPDGGVLSYLWTQTQGTAVTLSDATAAQQSFTAPIVGPTGESLTFSVTVKDEYGVQAIDTCTVNIVAANQPPVADAGLDQTVEEWAVVMLDGSRCSDPDDGIAIYSWEQIGGPAVNLMDADLAQPTFVTPDVAPEGVSLIFQVTVKDMSGLQSVDTCVVNVTWVNAPPVADAGRDQTVRGGKSLTLDGSASTDPDDGIASYQWRQTSGPPVVLSDPTSIKPVFMAPKDKRKTVLEFSLKVTDNSGLQSVDECKVAVK